MIDRGAKVSVKRQAQLLDLSRSSVYYEAAADFGTGPWSDAPDRRAAPGSPVLRGSQARRAAQAGRPRCRPATRANADAADGDRGTVPQAAHQHPRAQGRKSTRILLKGLAIERPNQVWASDISYLPMAHGFMYLVAILDVASRKVLAWRLSNTLTADFCVEALEEAMSKYGKPEIFNTDQGSQFTVQEWLTPLKAARVGISMDGKGRWIDNVFIERLWRSVKYEEVYLRGYARRQRSSTIPGAVFFLLQRPTLA